MYIDTQSPTSPAPTGGSVPAADDPWWQQAASWLGGLLKGSYPKPLPPPLPFSVDQVQAMLTAMPQVASSLRTLIAGQGHTHLYLGHQPSSAELQDLNLLAQLAIWFANGTGDDLSHGEDEIRSGLLSGMQAWAAQLEAAQSSSGPGIGVPPMPSPGHSALPAVGGLALVGALLWHMRG